MPTFDITAPDGKQYEIEGATAEGALAALQKHLGSTSAPAQQATAPAAAPADPFAAPTGAEAPPVLAAMGYGELAKTAGRTLDNIVRSGANSLTFGQADRFAGGMDALTGRAKNYSEGVDAQHAETEARRKEQSAAAVVGMLVAVCLVALG